MPSKLEYTAPWEYPASSAISSTEAPSKPRRAKTLAALVSSSARVRDRRSTRVSRLDLGAISDDGIHSDWVCHSRRWDVAAPFGTPGLSPDWHQHLPAPAAAPARTPAPTLSKRCRRSARAGSRVCRQPVPAVHGRWCRRARAGDADGRGLPGVGPSRHDGRRAAVARRLDRCHDRRVVVAGGVAEPVDRHVVAAAQDCLAGHRDLVVKLLWAQRDQVRMAEALRVELPARIEQPTDLVCGPGRPATAAVRSAGCSPRPPSRGCAARAAPACTATGSRCRS